MVELEKKIVDEIKREGLRDYADTNHLIVTGFEDAGQPPSFIVNTICVFGLDRTCNRNNGQSGQAYE